MSRTVKHLSLHRIEGTELRVVSDVELGALPVIQTEEDVIRRYSAAGPWPHRWVTLLILQDLEPLVRQLGARDGAAEMLSSLPPGGAEALDSRPVVNAYDLASPAGCHIFVNRRAMLRDGYWDDPLALRALLAHEHAHPLAEGETVRATRALRIAITAPHPAAGSGDGGASEQILGQLALLADELCLYAPREIAANELALRCGFEAPLLHLARRNMAAARQALAGRRELGLELQREQSRGRLAPSEAGALLLLADLRGYASWAFEVAAFSRSGCAAGAQELEAALQADVFPHLEPQALAVYATLREQYETQRLDLSADELLPWGQGLLQALVRAMAERDMEIVAHIRLAQKE
jgi:hypothetical protein